MKENQGTNETLLSSKNITENQLVAAALNTCPAKDMPRLWPTMGNRYGNTAVYSKSFVFMIACSAIKSVGTQIKEQPLLWDPSHHSGDWHSC